jgi:hypothetical protein
VAPRFLTLLKIRQSRKLAASVINENTVADFTRVVEETGILEREPTAAEVRPPKE